MNAWEILFDSLFVKGGYKRVLTGLGNTALLAVFGLMIGIVIGTVIAVVKVIPRYKTVTKIFQGVCDVYVAFFRGTPIVVQLLIGYYFLLPAIGIKPDPLLTGIVIFGLNSGAYVSEIMRSGVQSVDTGQLEAARALGMSFWVGMARIVVPQAVKNILPTLGNEFITLVKETSVVYFIGAMDLTNAFMQIASGNYEYTAPYLMLAVVYIVIILLITLAVKLLERRLKKSDRSR